MVAPVVTLAGAAAMAVGANGGGSGADSGAAETSDDVPRFRVGVPSPHVQVRSPYSTLFFLL